MCVCTQPSRGGLGACSPRKILVYRLYEIASGAFLGKIPSMYAFHLKVVASRISLGRGGKCPRLNATLFMYLLHIMHGECVHMPISCQVPSELVNYISTSRLPRLPDLLFAT